MRSYQDVEKKVFAWGVDRGIVQHGQPMGQAIKCLEECTELLDAINKSRDAAIADALGDIWVTLVMTAATMDMDLLDCMYGAYNEIKDRKGTLGPDGIFVKESAHANT